jgi:hypothetical protein
MIEIEVVQVRYVRDYTIWLRFTDGLEGELDLSGELWGEVFEPLKDKALFAQVGLYEYGVTICWPNGADLAPEFLYEQLSGAA